MSDLSAVNVDVVLTNGQGLGDMASRMLSFGGDVGAFRPYVEGFQMSPITGQVLNEGRAYIARNGATTPQQIVRNDATLLYDEWKAIDGTVDGVVETYRHELSAWNDLTTMTRPYRTPNGIGTLQLLTQTTTDPGSAVISMSGDVQEENARRTNSQTILPIPLIYSGFQLDIRELLASRAGVRALDLDQVEQCTRRVLEAQDALTIGSTTFTGPGGVIQGYTSFSSRNTATLTTPSGNFGPTLVAEVAAATNALLLKKFYGPYMVYYGIGWDTWLQTDYSTLKGENTALDRLKKLRNVKDVKMLPTLTGYQILVVQMDSKLVRPVIGQDPITVQWEGNGGMTRFYRVVACGAPQMRVDGAGNSGIVHMNV